VQPGARLEGIGVSNSTVLLRPADDPRFEHWLQLASRFTALVRSGRAYAPDHLAFAQLLESYLELLGDVLAAQGPIRFHGAEGDACVNGVRLPFRPNMDRALQQLVHELDARGLEAIEFSPGVTLAELSAFMGLFLPGERWKGADLVAACDRAGLVHARVTARPAPVVAESLASATFALPETLDAPRQAWASILRGARELLRGDALDQGVELRHLRRLVQPLVEAVLAGERMAAALAHVRRGEPAAEHAAHTALAALCTARRLGLSRVELAEVGVAALLHDVGHAWAGASANPERPDADHRLEGVRRIAWATTLAPLSLAAMHAALGHHADAPDATPIAQVVSIADAYVTLLARDGEHEQWLSPSGALARVLGPLRARWHPALPAALVRALGLYPPGQVVMLDDGSLARSLVPDPYDPARPWIERVEDARGLPVPLMLRTAVPLPAHRHVARALPRHEWPEEREAA
jgi:hypothetical protein